MSDITDLKLNEEEAKAITTLHRQAQDIVHSIGQAEVHKAKLLSQLADVEERAQGTMNSIGARLKIPQGTPWQIRPDGTVILMDPKTGQPQPPQSPPLPQSTLNVVPPSQ